MTIQCRSLDHNVTDANLNLQIYNRYLLSPIRFVHYISKQLSSVERENNYCDKPSQNQTKRERKRRKTREEEEEGKSNDKKIPTKIHAAPLLYF